MPTLTDAQIRDARARDHDLLVARNGVWGTCTSCPRENNGVAHPERCVNFKRSDHQLVPLWSVTKVVIGPPPREIPEQIISPTVWDRILDDD